VTSPLSDEDEGLVRRLRAWASDVQCGHQLVGADLDLKEAADRIEALAARNKDIEAHAKAMAEALETALNYVGQVKCLAQPETSRTELIEIWADELNALAAYDAKKKEATK